MGMTDDVIQEAYQEGIAQGLEGEELDDFVQDSYLDLVLDY